MSRLVTYGWHDSNAESVGGCAKRDAMFTDGAEQDEVWRSCKLGQNCCESREGVCSARMDGGLISSRGGVRGSPGHGEEAESDEGKEEWLSSVTIDEADESLGISSWRSLYESF